jgi:hypothetical protein
MGVSFYCFTDSQSVCEAKLSLIELSGHLVGNEPAGHLFCVATPVYWLIYLQLIAPSTLKPPVFYPFQHPCLNNPSSELQYPFTCKREDYDFSASPLFTAHF